MTNLNPHVQAVRLYEFLTDDGGEAEWAERMWQENDPYELGRIFCERRKQQEEAHAEFCKVLEELKPVVPRKNWKKFLNKHFPMVAVWANLAKPDLIAMLGKTHPPKPPAPPFKRRF
jgi:hypothetical protein